MPPGRSEARGAEGSPGAILTLETGAWADPPTAELAAGAAADDAADA
jgi:hypothetical protein